MTAKKGGKRPPLTCESFVIMPDGRTVPVRDLTPAEREQWHANMRRRASEAMNAYYTQHPDEYARLSETLSPYA